MIDDPGLSAESVRCPLTASGGIHVLVARENGEWRCACGYVLPELIDGSSVSGPRYSQTPFATCLGGPETPDESTPPAHIDGDA